MAALQADPGKDFALLTVYVGSAGGIMVPEDDRNTERVVGSPRHECCRPSKREGENLCDSDAVK
jgi:hypothetical protein